MMLPSVYTAKAYGLFVDGLDVLKEPVTPARYAVSIDSIEVTEAGSGGVSSMRFTIEDYSLVVTIADGAVIQFWDLTNNWPIFVGFLESITIRPDFGEQGRAIDVGAYGIEALLDTVIVPSLTSTYGDQAVASTAALNMWDSAFMQVIGSNTGLRTGSDATSVAGFPSPGLAASSLAGPIGRTHGNAFVQGTITLWPTTSVVLDGMTVRQAFEAFRAAAIQIDLNDFTASPQPPYFLSADFWGGIRLFLFGGGVTTYMPSDYATLTITDTGAGAVAAEGIRWEQDHSPNAIVNAVYVKGAAAASTGWVVGDTTTGRREGYATTAGTTAESKQSAATTVMSQRSNPAGRGTLTLTSYTPTNVHPGSQVVITDARVGFSSKVCLITEIRKTFNSGSTQNWTVSFIDGGDTPTAGAPSAMRLTRTYTRAVLH